MSYGSDFHERRRRRRQQDTRLLVYAVRSIVTTAALVAIAFAFDVPEKLRARFFAPQPNAVARLSQPQSVPQEPDPLPPPVQGNGQDPQPRNPAMPPQSAQKPIPEIEPPPPQQPNNAPPEKLPANPAPQQALPAPIRKQPEHETLALDLSKKQSRIRLVTPDDKVPPRVRVNGLGNVKAKYKLVPPDGMVGDGLEVLFPAHPRARLLVHIDKVGERFFLILEPQMALRADKPVPMTLKDVKRVAFRTRRDAQDFFTTLAAAKDEKAALEAWIKPGTGIKPLAGVRQAKNRINELTILIERMDAQRETVKNSVEELDLLEQIANSLHGQGELHFAPVDSE